MNSTDTLIIVPTRGRPRSVKPLVNAWRDTEASAGLLFAVDDDDPELDAYRQQFDRLGAQFRVGPRRRLAGTLNEVVAEEAPRYKAVGFFGDDHRPRTKGWDRRFAECLSGGTGVVYGNDLLVGDRFPTAVLMTSDIPLTLGYFCPPGFTHLCLDLVWKDWGEGIGRITYLADVVIEHVHPAAGKAAFDDRYAEVNSMIMVNQDSTAYHEYRAHGLDADLEKLRRLL